MDKVRELAELMDKDMDNPNSGLDHSEYNFGRIDGLYMALDLLAGKSIEEVY